MARFREYSANYLVEGVRFLSAPRYKVVAISQAEAELAILLGVQKTWPGRQVSIGTVKAGKQAR